MKLCTWPGCDNLTEGRTDYCATHGRAMRKQHGQINSIETKAKTAQQELNAYVQLKKKFIKGKECELKGVHFECSGPLDINHRKGRIGELLMDTKHWQVVCRKHHSYIHDHPEESYREGWSELRISNEPHQI